MALLDPGCSQIHAAVQKRTDTKSRLEQLTREIMEAHSLPDPNAYDVIRRWCTKDFLMENSSLHECVVPFADNLETHLRNVNALKLENPDLRLNVSNVSAIFDDFTQEMTVWYTSGASGGPESDWNSNRESVGVLHWRPRGTSVGRDGEWECYKHSCIRGGASPPPAILDNTASQLTCHWPLLPYVEGFGGNRSTFKPLSGRLESMARLQASFWRTTTRLDAGPRNRDKDG
ncbi:hypothetical protein PRZ48_009109 [Zasmidium cellare]|uniref:Uncharacterized protein n=1 Tax=Zasmidium cellare TaxID=395010 RepID=A0ABR0EHD7_ZASCE|nr:hypothetical protein PRZ48_009109 [Zasmidium cellare]